MGFVVFACDLRIKLRSSCLPPPPLPINFQGELHLCCMCMGFQMVSSSTLLRSEGVWPSWVTATASVLTHSQLPQFIQVKNCLHVHNVLRHQFLRKLLVRTVLINHMGLVDYECPVIRPTIAVKGSVTTCMALWNTAGQTEFIQQWLGWSLSYCLSASCLACLCCVSSLESCFSWFNISSCLPNWSMVFLVDYLQTVFLLSPSLLSHTPAMICFSTECHFLFELNISLRGCGLG